MRITDKTQYQTLAPVEKYLTKNAVQELKQAAEKRFGSMYELTFAQFYECTNGNTSEILGDVQQPTVLQVYWKKRFDEFVEEFAKQLKKQTLSQTTDEVQAAQGLLKVDWAEGLLVFLQSYFKTSSFKEAEKITIGEILIAKRAQYNQDLFKRKLAAIQTAKLKKK
ncbi:MAG: hypothetical protein J6U89_07380 [Bacteroidaceae bacterium]|nr:hypothetical protein [Bacteroidaceae bacterium]